MKVFLLLTLIIATIISYIDPLERGTWWMEAAPVFVAVPLLLATFKKFPLTPMLYVLLWCHAIVLLVGAHYTYAEVPLGDWVRDALQQDRNHYDRFGHFMQGFVPAIVARELLIRTSPLTAGKWMFALVTLSCLGISAIYELIEWAAAISGGQAADSFLGTQGDVWDTQKDMAMAGIGAMLAQLTLGRWHSAEIAKLKP